MAGLVFILILFSIPVLWQIPRTFWPVRLNRAGSAFTGLYRRYSIATVTGYASGISTSKTTQTVGNVTGYTSGYASDSYVSATTTFRDNRRTFDTNFVHFFLTDPDGATHTVDSANTHPSIGEGHLVSAAFLVHNGKQGNAFLIYDHSTDLVYVEDSRRGLKTAKNGIVKMVMKLPLAWIVILCLGIVTIPLVAILGLGAHWQVKMFRRLGTKRLVASLSQRAAEIPSASSPAVTSRSSEPGRDLAAQMRELTDMHDSGRLSAEEFQTAKARLLEA